jgi:hypothetical protein
MTILLAIVALVTLVQSLRVNKLENRVDDLEEWSDMEHDFIVFESDDQE